MTVCIAAACEQGNRVVIATDRRISYAGVSSDSVAAKMIWFGTAGEWLGLFAGEPANTALIFEEIEQGAQKTPITRKNVQRAVLSAYQKRRAIFSSFAALSPYDLSLEEFKAAGLSRFGESEFRRISQEISKTSEYFREQMLVVGWGAAKGAVMLYEISPESDRDHCLTGMTAIGTGQEVALSTMMLLGHSRDRTLAETIYVVACAKFASEKSQGEDVGTKTAMFVTWKRETDDDKEKPPGKFLSGEHVVRLHKLWLKYGKPHVSEKIYRPTTEIIQSMGLRTKVSNKMFDHFLRSAPRRAKRAQ